MLASPRRATTVIDALKKQGISPAALDRVHAPIGIEINSETPQEIAVSIMAEIIKVRRAKSNARFLGFGETWRFSTQRAFKFLLYHATVSWIAARCGVSILPNARANFSPLTR